VTIASLVISVALAGTPADLPDLPKFADRAELRYRFTPLPDDAIALGMLRQDDGDSQDAEASVARPIPVPPAFGEAGTRYWYLQGGWSQNLNTSRDSLAFFGAGLSFFIVDGLAFDIELSAMRIQQQGDDAYGINLNLLFRWHFIRERNWSLFIDAGAGMLGTTDHVPRNGSSFNFTPQAGMGVTWRLREDLRLIAGVKWQHISNANTFSDNPGRDSLEIYAGLMFPF